MNIYNKYNISNHLFINNYHHMTTLFFPGNFLESIWKQNQVTKHKL